MSDRRDRERWAGVDWSLSDRTIADALGVSPVSVRYHRIKRDLPPAKAAVVATFRAFAAAHRDDLGGVPVAEAVRRSGVKLSVPTATRLLRAAGVPTYRHPGGATVPSKFPAVNWELPNQVIADVWGLVYGSVRNERTRRKAPKAKWDVRSRATGADPAYSAAVAAERDRAGGPRVPGPR